MTASVRACPACGTRNRLPVVAGGHPRCATCHADLPWLVDVTGADFDDAIARSTVPVLVDLWAPWCGPCKMVAPILEQTAADRAGSLRVLKLNVDHAPEISARYGVQGIPTMLLFSQGVEVARQVGALPGPALDQWLDQHLASAG